MRPGDGERKPVRETLRASLMNERMNTDKSFFREFHQ